MTPNNELVAYVDTNLVGTGKVARAAILGLKGGVWAASAGFTVYNSLLDFHRAMLISLCPYLCE